MKRCVFVLFVMLFGNFAFAQDAVSDAELDQARERLDAAAREFADLQRQRGASMAVDVIRHVPVPMRLGLFFGRPGQGGIEVMGVTPDGPAAEAGLKAGDRLTLINGQALTGGDVNAVRALHAGVAELQPGEYVQLEYLRDGQPYSAEILLGEISDHPYAMFGRNGDASIAMKYANPGFATNAFVGRPMGVLLHDMNPGLGRYFGVDVGLLVLNGGDDPDGVMPGDVLTALNGVELAHQHELYGNLGKNDAQDNVTVIRDGGTIVLALSRDSLLGGISGGSGVMHAMPAGRLQYMEINEGPGETDILVNGSVAAPGEGL